MGRGVCRLTFLYCAALTFKLDEMGEFDSTVGRAADRTSLRNLLERRGRRSARQQQGKISGALRPSPQLCKGQACSASCVSPAAFTKLRLKRTHSVGGARSRTGVNGNLETEQKATLHPTTQLDPVDGLVTGRSFDFGVRQERAAECWRPTDDVPFLCCNPPACFPLITQPGPLRNRRLASVPQPD